MTRRPILALLSLLFSFTAVAQVPKPPSMKPPAPADLTAPPADAERSDDGLITRRLSAGTGTANPVTGDVVKLRYLVWNSTGKLVDSILEPLQAFIAVDKMMPGWRTAVTKMVVGEKRRAWIPESLGGGKIKPGEAYVIDTELLEIIQPPPTPEDVAAPPDDAEIGKGGLASKVLRPGTGTERPKARSVVKVHYTGWTTDGRLFDSTALRGEPAQFPLNGVILGWTHGLQLMTVGEKRRFWIPAKLAYANDPGKPQGMLVFDIELLEIK
ncbi:MAG TPA: FKBP-type peptidyl-prolyl cis-trans isomerase [Thermoanaerobaculia bacterium]|jgi:peptidylprolyl isomerase